MFLKLTNRKRKMLNDAKNLSADIKGIYAQMFLTNTEQALYEISVQAHSSVSEKTGVEKTVGNELVKIAIQLYPGASTKFDFESFSRKNNNQ